MSDYSLLFICTIQQSARVNYSECAPNDVWNFSIELEFRYLQAKPHNLQGLWRLCGAECAQRQWCYHPSLLIPEEIILPLPCHPHHIAAVLCRDTSTVSSSWQHCHSYTPHPPIAASQWTIGPSTHFTITSAHPELVWNDPTIPTSTYARCLVVLIYLYCAVLCNVWVYCINDWEYCIYVSVYCING